MKKRVRFDPVFLSPLLKDKDFLDLDRGQFASKIAVRGKKNIGRFFLQLYTTMFGGYESSSLFNPVIKINYEIKRRFIPDVTEYTDNGRVYTEVKSVSLRTNQITISKEQIENYSFASLMAYQEGDKLPEINFGFFRYGYRDLVQSHNLPDKKLIELLSQEVRELSIYPLNLLLATLMLNPPHKKDRATPNSSNVNTYYSVKGKIITLLQQPKGLEQLLQQGDFGSDLVDELMLDKLKIEQFESSDKYDIFCQRRKMAPFRITKYYSSDRQLKKWLKYFNKNNDKVLSFLGVWDIYKMYQDEEKRQKTEFPWETEERLEDEGELAF